MKKLIFIYVFALFSFSSNAQNSRSIYAITPGTLSTLLSVDEKDSISDLKVSGNIDARDFKFMRDEMALLNSLDISDVIINEYNGNEGTHYNIINYPADEIPSMSFAGKLTSVKLPVSLKSIGSESFNSSNITEIVFPDSLKVIGISAFKNCIKLTGNLKLPDSLKVIGMNAFNGCSGLTGSLVLPKTVVEIGESAFAGCSGFSGSLYLPDLISINTSVFNGCLGLNGYLIISGTTNSISTFAFRNCKFKRIYVMNNVAPPSLGLAVFLGVSEAKLFVPLVLVDLYKNSNSNWGNESAKFEIFSISDLPTDLIVENSISDFIYLPGSGPSEQFHFTLNNNFLTKDIEILIPEILEISVKQGSDFEPLNTGRLVINRGNLNVLTFYVRMKEGLSEGKYQDSIVFISESKKIKKIDIIGYVRMPPDLINVNNAGTLSSLLSNFEKTHIEKLKVTGNIDARDVKFLRDEMIVLSDLDLSDVNIKAYTGSGGTSAQQYEYKENSLPQWSFGSERYLNGKKTLKSIILPNSLTTIENNAFYYCSELNCNLDFPSGVTTIGNNSFYLCYNLTGALNLPVQLKTIGSFAFWGCWSFSGGLTIPDSVISIGVSAFTKCAFSGTLIIPNSVREIGNGAFGYSGSYSKIIVNKNVPPIISSQTFENINKNTCMLVVPKSSTIAYQTAEFWNEFKNIIESDFQDVLCAITVKMNNGGFLKENGNNIFDGTILSVEVGDTKTFTVFPLEGYEIKEVIYNGIDFKPQINNNQFTIPPINTNSTLNILFQKKQFRVSIKNAESGTVNLLCDLNSTPSFDFSPANGWKVNTILYNEIDVTDSLIDSILTLPAIKANGLLNVSFEKIQSLTDNLKNSSVKVYCVNSEIIIEGASTGEDWNLYSVNGEKLQVKKSNGNNVRFLVDKNATYLIYNKNATFKVIM